MNIAVTKESRRSFLLTAVSLSVPAVIELMIGFGTGDTQFALWFTAILDLCLIVLAVVLALLLALAGYGRQARGVIAGAVIGLLSLAAAIGLIVLAHQPPRA